MIGRIAIVLWLASCDGVLGLRSFDHPPPDAAPDAPLDAFVPEVGCSPMRMLADDFSSMPDPLWQNRGATNGNTIVPAAGQIQIGMNVGGLAVFGDHHFYDLRNDSLSVQVIVNSIDAGSYVQLNLVAETAKNSLQFSLENGKLVMRRIEGVSVFEVNRVPYTSADVYWRIANSGAHTTFETSPDGITYVVQGMVDDLPYIGFMKPDISAGSDGMSPFSVILDNIDQGLPPAHACRVVQLHDDFSGPALSQQWSRSLTLNGTLLQQGGTLDLTYLVNGSNTYFVLVPSTIYDLRDGAFTVEIPQMVDVTEPQLQLYLAISSLAGSDARFQQAGGTLHADKNGPTTVDARPYSPITHRWWRIREHAGAVYWETSPDGTAFTPLGMASDLTGLDRVDIELHADGVATMPTGASFDNIDP